MRPKMPSHVLLDHVRITREGGDAIIDHADANLSVARIVIGPGIATMTDADSCSGLHLSAAGRAIIG